MKTPVLSMLFFLLASIMGAAGQFFYREGTRRAAGGVAGYLLNGRILLGVGCYVAVMVLFVAAFKRGGSLTVLYPIYASTFIWASLIALFLDGQPIRLVNVAGMALLVGGMYLMGKS
jgi:multidrug transporter EmrE-like cation transporter